MLRSGRPVTALRALRDMAPALNMRYVSLALLTVQTCAASILVRLSRTSGTEYNSGVSRMSLLLECLT